ncbi:hypothetical protein LCGC14_0435150 [marine sediment metagenome]|uniref:Uncharacterized protein n=1 Tax=marine sediment metagenome TaxID=412755 RepID=A0A0F9VWD2_9ZZZZ
MVKKADIELKFLCFVVVCIFVISFSVNCFAQDTFDEVTENPKNPIVDTILDFDNMEIHLKHSEVRTYKVHRDANGDEVRREAGPNFIYRNEEENNPDTSYDDTQMHTIFMQKLGLNKAVIKQAVKEMELLKRE